MSINITEELFNAQSESGNLDRFIFISGISTNSTENFETTLSLEADSEDKTIRISGIHSYTGYMIIEDEVIEVLEYSFEDENTNCIVNRGVFGSNPSSHGLVDIYPVQFMDKLFSFSYKQKSDVSDSQLISISLDEGSLVLKDDSSNWSAYSDSKIYDYSLYQPIFIFEGMNRVIAKVFEGVTGKKFEDKVGKKITLEFKSSIDKVWKNSLNKSRMFYDNDLEDVLNYLYPDYTVEYNNGTLKSDIIKVKNMDLKSYATHSDFLNAMCRNSLCRLRFTTNKRIVIISDINIESLTTTKEIYTDVTKIDDSSTDLIFNKIDGSYFETNEYRDNDEYRRDFDTNEPLQSADVKAVQFFEFKTLTNVDVITDGKFNTITQAIDTSLVENGDYVLLKGGDTFSENSEEIWGIIVDVNEATADIALGSSKVSWLNQAGYIDELTGGTGVLNFANARLYYGFYELDIVNKYTLQRNSESRDSRLEEPVLPFVFYDFDTNLDASISIGDDEMLIAGDWEGVENYAIVGSEYVYMSGIFYDGTSTSCSIERGELGTLEQSHIDNETVTVVKYNNMLLNTNQFSFADIAEEKFSGLVSQIDDIWDTWYDGTDLKYNKELTQDIPIYLYSNTAEESDGVIKFTGYDNSKIAVKYERGVGIGDMVIKTRNTSTPKRESDLFSTNPDNSFGSIIELSYAKGSTIKAGDVLKLKELYSGDDNYTTYLTYKDVKWRVLSKQDSGSVYNVYLDNSWGSIKDGMEFVQYPVEDVVFLQELYVRGNPVMQLEKPISLSDLDSIKKHGEQPYTISGAYKSELDVRKTIDYFKNGYKSTSPENTRFKISTSVLGRYDIEVLDLVLLTDTLYSNLYQQKAICINKDVSVNSKGERKETLKFITVGDYQVNPSNVNLETSLVYNSNVIPKYSHTGDDLQEGTKDTVKDEKIINLTDSETGSTYAIRKIPTDLMSALVESNYINNQAKGINMDIYQVKGEDLGYDANSSGVTITVTGVDLTALLSAGDYVEIGTDYEKIYSVDYNGNTNITLTQSIGTWSNTRLYKNNYRKTVLKVDYEGIMLINNEYIKYKVISDSKLTFLKRGLFDSIRADIKINDQIEFYSILSATLGEKQIFTEFEAGDGVDNILSFTFDEGYLLKADNEINFNTGDNFFTMDKVNGIKVKANTFEVDSGIVDIKNSSNRLYFEPTGNSSFLHIGVTESSTRKLQVGNVSTTNGYWFFDGTNVEQRGNLKIGGVGGGSGKIEFDSGIVLTSSEASSQEGVVFGNSGIGDRSSIQFSHNTNVEGCLVNFSYGDSSSTNNALTILNTPSKSTFSYDTNLGFKPIEIQGFQIPARLSSSSIAYEGVLRRLSTAPNVLQIYDGAVWQTIANTLAYNGTHNGGTYLNGILVSVP